MPSPLLSFFSGRLAGRRAIETIVPERTFDDVILPPATRETLDQALGQVRNHNLIFGRWGLGERHASGLGLAFNFAGPPGTGKTICAEAIAHALGRRLLLVRYAELESMWMGETPKNVAAIFRAARGEGAVLLFDEADAIASRRSTTVDRAGDRESNTVVNVLLQELESYDGVVIFTTNLAANLDPAFERRIRTHVLFELPGPVEREQIWRVQMHPSRTPLAADVDFRSLAERYPVSGGDIRNAVLKAALAAAAEPGPDSGKRIHQRHFEAAIAEVVGAKQVMGQSLFAVDERADGTPQTAASASRLVIYAMALAAAALMVAAAALVVSLCLGCARSATTRRRAVSASSPDRSSEDTTPSRSSRSSPLAWTTQSPSVTSRGLVSTGRYAARSASLTPASPTAASAASAIRPV